MKKVVLVTGASIGIGFEICKLFALNNYDIILNDIDQNSGELAVKELNSVFPDKVMGYFGDCSDIDFNNKMVFDIIEKYNKIDVFIANAGITLFGDFLTYMPADFDKVLGLNLRGTFFLTQTIAKEMKEKGGSIVFISSVVGHQAHKNLAAYAITKAGLEMFAKNLVEELSEYKIRINTVAPGATLTSRTNLDGDYKETWSKITPLGKPAEVSEIAEAVYFIANAKHITGQTLIVDGGWTSVSPSPY